ncbi:MAG TPA: hypothetical protein V6C97_27535 [Oculatellaceae cyanobacterium]
MGAPVLATARILFPYTVSSKLHKAYYYVKGANEVGSAWFIQGRAGVGTQLPWESCADGISNAFNAIMGSTASYGQAQLQEQIGLIWYIRSVHTLTTTATGTAPHLACQMTATLRTQSFYHAKVVVLEPIEDPEQSKLISPTGGSTAMDTFLANYSGAVTTDFVPWNWMVGQDEEFLTDSPFISATFSLNHKLRKARGMA